MEPSTINPKGNSSPTAFTQDNLGWEAWISARDAKTLSVEEAQVMKNLVN